MTAPDIPFAAVIVMAGSGARLGAAVPKAFVLLGGQPLWRHSAERFAGIATCREVVLVVPADRVDEVKHAMPSARVVAGGARRQDSVRLGIAAISPGLEIVAIHDAARPFVGVDLITSCVFRASETGTAVSAVPVRDTIKRVAEGAVAETLDRSTLWQAQTPQTFRLGLIREAHAEAERRGWDVTDDCALMERLGRAVAVVRGSVWNFKVTEPEDLAAAEALLGSGAFPAKEKR